ncbi:hypothetical protein Tco_0383081 [Tanacetum coccineum]
MATEDLSTLHLDELIDNLKVYGVMLDKDSEVFKNKKEKYKSLTLKAKKESSDEETSSSDSEDEEYAMAVIDFNKFFKEEGDSFDNHMTTKRPSEIDCTKHPDNDQKAFVGGSWSDSDEDVDLKKDEIYLMAHESNEVINKNKLLKNELLDNEIFELKERLKKLEKNKSLDELRLARLNRQKILKKLIASDVPDPSDPFESDPASTVKGSRASDAASIKLKSSITSRTIFVQITKKTPPSATVENTKQPPALK